MRNPRITPPPPPHPAPHLGASEVLRGPSLCPPPRTRPQPCSTLSPESPEEQSPRHPRQLGRTRLDSDHCRPSPAGSPPPLGVCLGGPNPQGKRGGTAPHQATHSACTGSLSVHPPASHCALMSPWSGCRCGCLSPSLSSLCICPVSSYVSLRVLGPTSQTPF